MNTIVKQWITCAVFVSALMLFMGMMCVLSPAGTAYAADGASGQGLAAAQGGVAAQDALVVNPSIPAPTNTASQYEVYPTYFFFNAGLNSQAYCDLYMDYRIKGGAWKTSGYMYAVNNYTFTGLKPKKTYQARLYYKNIYTGEIGRYSPIVTFKTAPNKKPPVKSVKTRIVKLKKHRGTVYGYYTGLPLGKYTYYTYRIKTTVKLKKRPKAKYIAINGKVFKAKKKKYTVTTKKLVKNYSSPRGDKYKVSVYTYQNKVWKGYSKLYQKTRKLRSS